MSLPNNYKSHHGRSLRPSPTNDSHSGQSYPDQGRTTLPPLTIAFPTSDSRGSLLNFTPTTQLNLSSPTKCTTITCIPTNSVLQSPHHLSSIVVRGLCRCKRCFPVSNSHVKTSPPSSKRRFHTIILRTHRLLNSQDVMVVRHMALITELHHPLVQPSLGSTRPRPRIPRKNSISITPLMLTRIRNTGRMTRPLCMQCILPISSYVSPDVSFPWALAGPVRVRAGLLRVPVITHFSLSQDCGIADMTKNSTDRGAARTDYMDPVSAQRLIQRNSIIMIAWTFVVW
jgi:hypothetical protein